MMAPVRTAATVEDCAPAAATAGADHAAPTGAAGPPGTIGAGGFATGQRQAGDSQEDHK